MHSAASYLNASKDMPMISLFWAKITGKPNSSTAELIQTSFTRPRASHTAPPTISLREEAAPTLPLEASHDREHSTSSGSLTFHTLYFVILLMHGRCLLLSHFWHMLNVKQGRQTRWSKTPGSPINYRDCLHQLAITGQSVTWPWSVNGSVFHAILQTNASHLSSDAGIITWSNMIKISEPSAWALPPSTNLSFITAKGHKLFVIYVKFMISLQGLKLLWLL